MTPLVEKSSGVPTWEIRQGDALERLREMPDESARCCVTSPPYFGLRDYGTAEWDGGDPGCDHRQVLGGNGLSSSKQVTSAGTQGYQFRDVCGKCGARRVDRQLGPEASPDEYVASMVDVFREVHRVLQADGTLWLNIGDSYAGSWGAQSRRETPSTISRNQIINHPKRAQNTGSIPAGAGYKAKDLLMIPAQLALALRADGWYLRSDIIWAKPNPMPESVTDRPTSAHEHIFLLAKSARYFYDVAAIREPDSGKPSGNGFARDHRLSYAGRGQTSQWLPTGQRHDESHPEGRNKRNVWTVATQPYTEAHFAVFPAKLIEPCILAGSAPGDVVIDPFAGSGTTGVVALRHGRSFVGLELNPEYVELARRRITDDAPLLNSTAEVAA